MSQWKPSAPLLEAVHEVQSVTAVLWSGGRRGLYTCKTVFFASSFAVVNKKSPQSRKEGFVSLTLQPMKCNVPLLCKNGEYGMATCQQPATPCKSG